MKLLIVDDEKFNLMMAKDVVEQKIPNLEVVLCNDPEQVMAILKHQAIDIVLLDIMMPKINGIEVLKMIRSREEYKNIQILMFTGLTDQDSFNACFESGANDYINKPINIHEFVARVRAALKDRANMVALNEMYLQAEHQFHELEVVTKKLKDTQSFLVQNEKLASLGEIAAGVAHEINNPIGFIGSNLNTMTKYCGKIKELIGVYRNFVGLAGNENSARSELTDKMLEIQELEHKYKLDNILNDLEPIITESKVGVDRVAKIVQSLRNFARTGNDDEKALSDINQILEEALLIIWNEIKYNVNLSKNLGAVPMVMCDKNQIEQVLINIIINAAQAIKSQKSSGMGNITIETYTEDNFVVCKIMDDGPGITEEHLGKIFDPFFTTKEVGSGTGLGLSIAYGIITKHGGQLLAESEAAKGASFMVKLPASI